MTQDYAAPALEIVGSVESLTAHTAVGNTTDQAFPANTPVGVILQNLS